MYFVNFLKYTIMAEQKLEIKKIISKLANDELRLCWNNFEKLQHTLFYFLFANICHAITAKLDGF